MHFGVGLGTPILRYVEVRTGSESPDGYCWGYQAESLNAGVPQDVVNTQVHPSTGTGLQRSRHRGQGLRPILVRSDSGDLQGGTVSYVITGVTHVEEQPHGSFDVTGTGLNVLVPKTKTHSSGLFFTSGTVSWTVNLMGRREVSSHLREARSPTFAKSSRNPIKGARPILFGRALSVHGTARPAESSQEL